MDDKNIRKYAQLMQEFGLTCVEITEDGTVVRLERNIPSVAAVSVPAPVYAAAPAAAAADASPDLSRFAASDDLETVECPLVGVFYRAPSEDAEPFVKVGDHVSKGDVLAIVEAMKLMNEITSDYEGTIAEVCVTNGSAVDFGAPLFRIKKD